MKKYAFLVFASLSLLFYSCQGNSEKKQSSEEISENKIEVIDFHSTHRCMTCNAIEANTKFTLETYFAKELKNKSITFQAVNVDKEENYKLAEKFEATGTSLFLNVIYNGKETAIDLTNFAFMDGTNRELFSTKLKTILEEQLKNL